jgi:hypothetical protein
MPSRLDKGTIMSFHSHVDQALFQLADPRRESGPIPNLTEAEWERLFALAGTHGVLGIVLENLKEHDLPTTEAWQLAQRRWRAEFVISVRLRHHGMQIVEAFKAAAIPATIVKGIDFADHLYPQPNLRPTRDVDVLIPREFWSEASQVLDTLNYFYKPGPWSKHETDEYGEQCWRHRTTSEIAVELHWNMVRNPSSRRRASVGYGDLNWLPESKLPCTTPASRLLIAAVHATISHQFDRLLLLCDIREACRQIEGNSSVEELRDLTGRTGSRAAVDIALAVTARLFNDANIADLRRHLGTGLAASLGASLVSKHTLVYSNRRWQSLRRSALREWLKRAA